MVTTTKMKEKMMTKLFARKPHPARRARIATATISSTAFLTVISSFAWNTHIADLAASSMPITPVVPVTATGTATDAGVPVTPAAPVTAVSTAPAPTVTTTSATPAKKAKTTKAKSTKAKATPAKKAKAAKAPKTQNPAPTTSTAPAPAPKVVYTCKSPGGKTQQPTSSGKCKNSQYGYKLTKV
jgi:hypothetical protein